MARPAAPPSPPPTPRPPARRPTPAEALQGLRAAPPQPPRFHAARPDAGVHRGPIRRSSPASTRRGTAPWHARAGRRAPAARNEPRRSPKRRVRRARSCGRPAPRPRPAHRPVPACSSVSTAPDAGGCAPPPAPRRATAVQPVLRAGGRGQAPAPTAPAARPRRGTESGRAAGRRQTPPPRPRGAPASAVLQRVRPQPGAPRRCGGLKRQTPWLRSPVARFTPAGHCTAAATP